MMSMSALEQKVFSEQVHQLYIKAPISLFFNTVTAVILGIVFWGIQDHSKLIVWVASLITVVFVHWVIVLKSLKGQAWRLHAKQSANLFSVCTAVTGVAWGIGFWAMISGLDHSYQLIFLFAIGGLAIAAMAAMPSLPRAYFSFITPVSVMVASWYILQGDVVSFSAAVFFLLFIYIVRLAYLRNYELELRSIYLRFEKDGLIDSLTQANQQLEDANRQINHLSQTDELTQVANRRRLDQTLNKEWARCLRANRPISLLMVDIDYFKKFNDHFGHQDGDRCLCQVAQAMSQCLHRPYDLLARYGGEEFVIVLPDTHEYGARQIADAMIQTIAELKICHPLSPVHSYVTISCGTATSIPLEDHCETHLLNNADRALYRAKENGRNQIISWNKHHVIMDTDGSAA